MCNLNQLANPKVGALELTRTKELKQHDDGAEDNMPEIIAIKIQRPTGCVAWLRGYGQFPFRTRLPLSEFEFVPQPVTNHDEVHVSFDMEITGLWIRRDFVVFSHPGGQSRCRRELYT